MRIALSGGGTGGHIFPALAVAERLQALQPEAKILYIGGVSGMEADIVPATGVPFQAVTTRKLRKLLSPGTAGVFLSLAQGYREAYGHLRAFKAEAVVGTGGYVAASTVLAGAALRVPILIHEGNATPGRTNRFLARFSRHICLTFEETASRFPAGRTTATGLPLREGIIAPAAITPQEARCRFPGLDPARFTVVVIGGSQGARAINSLILGILRELTASGVQVLHQTGAKNVEEVREQAAALRLPERSGYLPMAFLDAAEMPLAFRAADLIVCRGGVSTLSELMVNGLPAIVIPLPSAYADHQTANAKVLANAGAAQLMPQPNLTPQALSAEILALRNDPGRRRRMSAASKAKGRPNAAEDVARLVLEMGAGTE